MRTALDFMRTALDFTRTALDFTRTALDFTRTALIPFGRAFLCVRMKKLPFSGELLHCSSGEGRSGGAFYFPFIM